MGRKYGILVCIAIIQILAEMCEGGSRLRHNFYTENCPSAEATVERVVMKYITRDPTLAAPLLRMHFHDCFVRGCDGSILLNSTANKKSEKDAIPNLSLRGYEIIDEAKARIENKCPGVVSCADILSLAARDAVVAKSGGPFWRVKTGRRDGRVSIQSEVLRDVPSPFFNFSQLKTSFANKGLSVKDLVVLSGGGHTIGIGHCNLFSQRLYNFTGKGDMDPSLDKSYATFLKGKCRSLTDTTTVVEMDPRSSLSFDSHYFRNLNHKRGLFVSDAALLTNPISKKYVNKQLDNTHFFKNFKHSIRRMGEIEVLTGSAGEIRRHCALIN